MLIKSSLLCKESKKTAFKCKFLLRNDDAILIYWTLNNTVFTFYDLGFAAFKLLNHLSQISLMNSRRGSEFSSYKIELRNSYTK